MLTALTLRFLLRRRLLAAGPPMLALLAHSIVLARLDVLRGNIYVHVCVYVYLSIYLSIYIYFYIQYIRYIYIRPCSLYSPTVSF